jgi:uncharacterized phage protein (TIGR01671 family)
LKTREIKFRAWFPEREDSEPFMKYFGLFDLAGRIRYDGIIMQYAGLKDKSGREIYEFDLIVNDSRNSKKPHKVEFLDGKFMGIYGRLCYDLYCELHEIEIIGNLYENPELLENT